MINTNMINPGTVRSKKQLYPDYTAEIEKLTRMEYQFHYYTKLYINIVVTLYIIKSYMRGIKHY